jgi:hypothetical protein
MTMNNPSNVAAASTDAAADHRLDLRRRQLCERHWFMLCLAAFVIAVAFCLRFSPGGALRLPWSDVALPTICSSRLLFGVECPGCGLTRSFVALAGGDFLQSYRFHRVGWLVALAVAIQIPYRMFALRELRQRLVPRPWLAWLGYSLIAALILNWILKAGGI